MAGQSRIERSERVLSTPYCALVAKTLRGSAGDPYYSLALADYVCVVAVTDTHDVPLVRQYRPAVEAEVLELPSGHVEAGEAPADAARRELEEETGFTGTPVLLGCLKPDTGRLGNRMWCYFVDAARRIEGPFTGEAGVELVLCSPAERPRLLAPPQFDHALHLAALQLAIVQGKLPLQDLALR